MKIDVHSVTKQVRVEAENSSDVFLLGKLAAKIRNAQHYSSGEKHTLVCDQDDFLKLALDACKP